MHDGSCIGINSAHRFPKCFRSLHTLLRFSLCTWCQQFTCCSCTNLFNFWPVREFLVEIHTAKMVLWGVVFTVDGTEMADVEQTPKMIPLITCGISLGQHVCEKFFGVNVFDLDFGVQIDTIEQPIKSNSVGSGNVSLCRTSSLYRHLDHCFVVFFKHNKASLREECTFEERKSTLSRSSIIPWDFFRVWSLWGAARTRFVPRSPRSSGRPQTFWCNRTWGGRGTWRHEIRGQIHRCWSRIGLNPFLFLFLTSFCHRNAANQDETFGAAKRAEMAHAWNYLW